MILIVVVMIFMIFIYIFYDFLASAPKYPFSGNLKSPVSCKKQWFLMVFWEAQGRQKVWILKPKWWFRSDFWYAQTNIFKPLGYVCMIVFFIWNFKKCRKSMVFTSPIWCRHMWRRFVFYFLWFCFDLLCFLIVFYDLLLFFLIFHDFSGFWSSQGAYTYVPI